MKNDCKGEVFLHLSAQLVSFLHFEDCSRFYSLGPASHCEIDLTNGFEIQDCMRTMLLSSTTVSIRTWGVPVPCVVVTGARSINTEGRRERFQVLTNVFCPVCDPFV